MMMWLETPSWFQGAVIFIFAICIGSFLNVLIYRLPRSESIVSPGSRCPHCRHALSWYFNIPLLSYILIRGKCHYCGAPVSSRYFFVELITGILITALYFVSLRTPSPLFYFLFFSLFLTGLIVATFIDLEHYLIPDLVSLGGIPLGILSSSFLPFMMEQTTPAKGGAVAFFSALFGGSLLLIISYLGKKAFKKEAMGMGDVKLMAMIGAFLGIKKVCLTLFFGSVAGSLISVALVLKGNAGWKSQIPFGPYLTIGAVGALFFGDAVWNWYFGQF